MTVDELIHILDLLPADAVVVISTPSDGDIEDFTVTLSESSQTVALEASE